MFTQSITLYIFYSHIIKECRCLKNVIHQIYRNEWLLLSAFQQVYCKIWVGFCLNTSKRFLLEVSFWSQQKEHWFFLKTVLGIFKIALRLRGGHVFMWQSVEILNVFNTLALKQIFWKMQTLFKKPEYRFLVESTKIDNATFPYKTFLSEATVKTNRMGGRKWTYHKERCFARN